MKNIIKILIFAFGFWLLIKLLNKDNTNVIGTVQAKTLAEPEQSKNLIVRSNGVGQTVKTYDNIKQVEIEYPESHTIEPGTVHAYSYFIEGGACDVEIDGVTQNKPDGAGGSAEVGTTFKQKIVFTPESGTTIQIEYIY